jgi:L-fucose mutarotase
MLKTGLIHPQILSAIGAAGHGSGVLISDGNFPHDTAPARSATRVYLNLRPGMISVVDALEALLTQLPIESAAVMVPPDGTPPPIHATFAELLTAEVPIRALKRQEFYDATADPNLALVIATGEQRLYACLLLTIGVVPEPAG